MKHTSLTSKLKLLIKFFLYKLEIGCICHFRVQNNYPASRLLEEYSFWKLVVCQTVLNIHIYAETFYHIMILDKMCQTVLNIHIYAETFNHIMILDKMCQTVLNIHI